MDILIAFTSNVILFNGKIFFNFVSSVKRPPGTLKISGVQRHNVKGEKKPY